jgi:hypothetical protein
MLIEQLAEELLAACHRHLDAFLADDDLLSSAGCTPGHDAVRDVTGLPTPTQAAATRMGLPDSAPLAGGTHGSDHGSGSESDSTPVLGSAADPRAMVRRMCVLLHQVWQQVDGRTPLQAPVVLKSLLGAATSALLAAVQAGLLDDASDNTAHDNSQLVSDALYLHSNITLGRGGAGNGPECCRTLALATAHRFSSELLRMYGCCPWMDNEGAFDSAEAARVHNTCTHLLADM